LIPGKWRQKLAPEGSSPGATFWDDYRGMTLKDAAKDKQAHEV
jgi:hypothetical protein